MNWFKPCIPNCIAAKPAEIGLTACLHRMFLPCFEFHASTPMCLL
jgi:hypothetical protein